MEYETIRPVGTLTTLLLSGHVNHIHLYADQSGITHSSYAQGWMIIPIALAGYFGSSLFAVLMFRLHKDSKERYGLSILAVLATLSLALFVRNGYGMLWCAGFAVMTIVISVIAPLWLRNSYYLLLAFICLLESVLSPIVLVALTIIDPTAAGDSTILAEATFIPAIVWALLFAAFSLWCAKMATSLLIKKSWIAKSNAK